MLMAIKLERVVTYHEGLPPIELYGLLITWSYEITWQTKTFISPQPSHCLPRSPDKLEALYLHYRSVYDHQTWQDDDLSWALPTHKITRPFKHVFLRNHVTNWKHISTAAVSMATKLGRMVTYLEGLLPIKLHDPLIACSYKITYQTKTIISPLPQYLWPPNLAGLWLTSRGLFP